MPLGMMWRKTMRVLEAPIARSDSTKSWLRNVSAMPRMRRAAPTQPSTIRITHSTSTLLASCGVESKNQASPLVTKAGTGNCASVLIRIDEVMSRIGSVGMESRNSTVREMTPSNQPP